MHLLREMCGGLSKPDNNQLCQRAKPCHAYSNRIMHQDRFYISYTPTGHEIWIDGKEAHHILHVKRAKPGSKITLFDGNGIEYLANITEILDDKLKVFIEQTRKVNSESSVDVTIAFSIPKGKHAIFLIQKCAELGIKTIIPLHCERSIVDIRHKSAEKTEKKTIKSLLHKHPTARKIFCLVGPEGIFTRSEVEMAEKSGCIPVSIGHSVLRIETAVVAISAMLLYAYSD